jgi:succinate dehydrogenase hydrophobic anchor subunit
MNADRPLPGAAEPGRSHYRWLERVTAVVLILVLAALGWMALAACYPAWDWWLSQDVQVGLVLALLALALILVSLVALLHTHAE